MRCSRQVSSLGPRFDDVRQTREHPWGSTETAVVGGGCPCETAQPPNAANRSWRVREMLPGRGTFTSSGLYRCATGRPKSRKHVEGARPVAGQPGEEAVPLVVDHAAGRVVGDPAL